MKRITVCSCLVSLIAVSAGVSGSCSFGGGLILFTSAPLHQTDCTITISEVQGAADAAVEASVMDGSRYVRLQSDQSIQVNDTALDGPASGGSYDATIDAANQYVVTVTEPTRGVEDTIIDAPADFAITSHADGDGASLSGFVLTWSNADAALEIELHITQRILGRDHEKTLSADEDTGTMNVSAADLSQFQQGADVTLTLTKIRETDSVAGFASGLLQARKSVSLALTPGA